MGSGNDALERIHRMKRRVFWAFLALLAVVLLLLAIWLSVLIHDVGWVAHEVADTTVTCCPSLSETTAGELLMAYGTSNGLMLSTEGNDGWTESQVMASEAGGDEFYVRAVSLALDAGGKAHIASVSYWPGIGVYGINRLVYSEQTSSGWENTVIDENVSDIAVSLTVDSESNAHMAYAAMKSDYWAVRNATYATDATGEWRSYDISSKLPRVWSYYTACWICVDSSGRPHMAIVAEYMAGHVTDLAGTPVLSIVGYGDARMSGIYPSRPAIVPGPAGSVHVLCYDERQEVIPDGPVERTLVHFTYAEGEGSYENSTLDEGPDLSWAPTQAVLDPDGGSRLFYVDGRTMGMISVGAGGETSDESMYILGSSYSKDVSMLVDAGGVVVAALPVGALGYVTDSFTLTERLSTALEPVRPTLALVVIAVLVISVAVVLSRRALVEDAKWLKALEK